MAFESPWRIRDTFDVRRKNASSADENVSEGGSSIEELSKAEENQMRHSFNAIREPETVYHPYIDLQEDSDYNSNRRYVDPADRISLDDDESENGESDDVKFTNESTRPKRIVNFADTDDTLSKTLEGAFQPVSLDTRNSTPDSVVSSGKISLRTTQGFGSDIRANNFGRTMRDRIHEISSSIRQSKRPTDPVDKAPFKEEEADDRGSSCLWKGVLFVIVVVALVAGILILVITRKQTKDDDYFDKFRGNVIPDPITYRECFDITLELGKPITLNCSFDVTHDYRRNLTTATHVIVTPPYQQSSVMNFTIEMIKSDSGFHDVSVNINVTSTCQTRGLYRLTFKNINSNFLMQSELNVSIKSSTPETSLSQYQVGQDPKLNKTWFQLKCGVSGDCNSYNVYFTGSNSSGEFSMNAEKECTVSYKDTSGYSIGCSATYPEGKIRPFNSLYCKMESAQKKHRNEFMFPGCSNDCEPDDDTPYNCSVKSPFRIALDTCDVRYIFHKNCFHEDRKLFTETVCPDGVDAPCGNFSATHCRLSWCKLQRRSFIRIYRDQVPGLELCGDSFREVIPTTPFVLPSTTTQPNTTN